MRSKGPLELRLYQLGKVKSDERAKLPIRLSLSHFREREATRSVSTPPWMGC